jgi:NAD(P)-dependent dehydrogenase (short-subunit alcohol dehydrogenase family)
MAKAVLVTGASTGIGEATALRMKRAGWDVFAGARKDADLERLRGEGLAPLKLDVTDADSIASAKAELDERGLHGLVNNAGVAVSGPMEFVPLEELRHQLEVNLVGQVAVMQAFMPNIREATGRIVNVSSIGGRFALPMVGPYAASKHALEAVSDSLRRELRPWGIHVSVIEPGAVVTPIWDKGRETADRLEDEMGAQARSRYGKLAARIRQETEKIPDRGVGPDEVAKAIEQALTASRPKTRYVVGRDAKMRLKMKAVARDRGMDALIARTLNWK